MTSSRLVFLVAALLLSPVAAFAQNLKSEFDIRSADGSPVANHRVPAELAAKVEKLPGRVVVGNPDGDVTLAQFYDLNCPFCRKASADVEALLKSDKKLRLVLVPFPVLGIPSIQAGRVELAVAQLVSPQIFFDFHRKLYEGRGGITGERALAVAQAMNIDQEKIIALADRDSITETMKAHARLGNALGFAATPSYVVADVAIIGHPGEGSLRDVIGAVRRCGKVVC